MKVLLCIPCLLTGGTEIQTLSLVEALVEAGHRVCVVCYFEYSSAMVERYKCAGADVRLLSSDSSRPQGLRRVTALLWRGLRQIIREYHPDVAHVQYMAPGALPVVILKILGIKHILATSHTAGDIYSSNGLRLIRFLTKTCLTTFQCITLKAEESYFGNSQIFDGTIHKHFTIYNSLPSHISLLSFPRRPKSSAESTTVGVVSRLESIKGMDLVIPAFALVCKQTDKARLLIAGDGSLRKSMEAEALALGIDDKVDFIGRQPQSALNDIYDNIDILLMPSRSEGFGLTALEGMARGCVPVVSNLGGLPEVVLPGTGLLHAPDDTGAIANAVLSLISEPKRLSSMSEAALKRASQLTPAGFRHIIARLYSALK